MQVSTRGQYVPCKVTILHHLYTSSVREIQRPSSSPGQSYLTRTILSWSFLSSQQRVLQEKPVQKVMTKAPFSLPHDRMLVSLTREKQLPPALLLKILLHCWCVYLTSTCYCSDMSKYIQFVTTGHFNCLPLAIWSRHDIQSYIHSLHLLKHRKPVTQRNAKRKSFWRENASCR